MADPLNPKEVGDVAQYLFDRYIKEKNIPRDNIPELQPNVFLEWLATITIDPFEIAALLGVDHAAAVYVLQLAHEPAGVNKLIVIWPSLLMKDRVMKHKLQSMQLFLVLHWQDQVVAPLSIYVHKDALIGGSKLDDATVCAVVTQNSGDLLNDVKASGLDGIHDKQQNNGIFAAPRIIQLTQDLVNGTVKRKEVADSDMAAINQLLLFVSTMFPSELPDNIKAMVAAGNREAQGLPPEASEGGFPKLQRDD